MDLTNYKISTSKANSERSILIEDFLMEINKERENKLPPVVIGVKLSHIPTKDLYVFFSMCKDYKARKGSFSKAFWGMLKI